MRVADGLLAIVDWRYRTVVAVPSRCTTREGGRMSVNDRNPLMRSVQWLGWVHGPRFASRCCCFWWGLSVRAVPPCRNHQGPLPHPVNSTRFGLRYTRPLA